MTTNFSTNKQTSKQHNAEKDAFVEIILQRGNSLNLRIGINHLS